MFRSRTADEIRRHDLMKLLVLLGLILALILAWYFGRGQLAPNLLGENMMATPAVTAIDESLLIMPGDGTADAIAEGQETPTLSTGVETTLPVIVVPSIDVPPGSLSSGRVTVGGMAGSGNQVVLLADSQPVGTAVTGDDGAWSIIADLSAGIRALQVQVIDEFGNVLSESPVLSVVVEDAAAPEAATPEPETQEPAPEPTAQPEAQIQPPVFNPSTGVFELGGTAAPGTMITLSSGGVIIGAVNSDTSGAWTAGLDGTLSGDIQVESINADGNTVSTTVTLPMVEEAGSAGGDEEVAPGGEGAQTGLDRVDPTLSIVNLLRSNPADFSILLSALDATGLTATFEGEGAFTFFAPTNEAFNKLPEPIVTGLVNNPVVLAQVLQYHVTRGRYLSGDLQIVAPSTLNNLLLTITPAGDTLRINDALVINDNNQTANGVVHIIDRVLVPPLATGVRPPVIDESGIPTFTGPELTIVGTAQPGSTILIVVNDKPFGSPATVDPSGFWQVLGNVASGEYLIRAYMLDAAGSLQAVSRSVNLNVR